MLAAILTSPLSAAEYFGDGAPNSPLDTNGFCYFDWYRPTASGFVRSKSEFLSSQPVKLQSRFKWSGSGTVPYVGDRTGEHAIVAFTQGTMQEQAPCGLQGGAIGNMLNSPNHPGPQQWIHRYGVGALLTPKGLALELWNGDGTSYLWTQSDNNRCAVVTPNGTLTSLCLTEYPDYKGDHISSLPGFQIVRGALYWVRVTVTGNVPYGPGWAKLYAELIEQTAYASVPRQTAQLHFQVNQFFPFNTPIESAIGRTGPEVGKPFYNPGNIQFWSFNGGF